MSKKLIIFCYILIYQNVIRFGRINIDNKMLLINKHIENRIQRKGKKEKMEECRKGKAYQVHNGRWRSKDAQDVRVCKHDVHASVMHTGFYRL